MWQGLEAYFFPRQEVKWVLNTNYQPFKEQLLDQYKSKVNLVGRYGHFFRTQRKACHWLCGHF